ncbi:MAG: hypothetical protein J0L84_13815, partial [Verrucomicrobia bacterium]|nr:hypothetical protein [Verrucomicrobiota bacterium]
MFLHRVLPLVGACLLVGLLAALMGRHEQIRALEASLPTQSAAAEAVSLPVDAGRRAASVPLSDEEQRELLTLRRQVGEGRRRRAAL